MVVADTAHIAVVADAHHGDPEHDEAHEDGGEHTAQPELFLEGEELRYPHHAVEEHEQDEDGHAPGQGLHHPLLRGVGEEGHVGEAVFLQEHPRGHGPGNGQGEQHHFDDALHERKEEDGHGNDGQDGEDDV